MKSVYYSTYARGLRRRALIRRLRAQLGTRDQQSAAFIAWSWLFIVTVGREVSPLIDLILTIPW